MSMHIDAIEIVNKLRQSEPYDCDGDGAPRECLYCKSWQRSDGSDGPLMFMHDEKCPWISLPYLLGHIRALEIALSIYAADRSWESEGRSWRDIPSTSGPDLARHALGLPQVDNDDNWVTEHCEMLFAEEYEAQMVKRVNDWINQSVEVARD